MKKFKIFIDFDKEEQYLNDMAKKGFLLKKHSLFRGYSFSKGGKQDLKYRIDYRIFNNKNDFRSYKAVFEEFGWEHVYGTKSSGNQYFLSKKKDPNQEMFSSKESEVSRYKRFYKKCIMSIVFAVIYFVAELSYYQFKLANMLFQPPGLWERSASEILKSMSLNYPFVAIRILPSIILIIISLIYGILAYKIQKLYKDRNQQI